MSQTTGAGPFSFFRFPFSFFVAVPAPGMKSPAAIAIGTRYCLANRRTRWWSCAKAPTATSATKLAALREPLQKGGSQQDQDTIIEMLKTSATRDQEPLCRMAAVRTLGHFKDPRAPEILETAYLENLTFGRAMNGLLRQQCLTSMADCGGPVRLTSGAGRQGTAEHRQ